MARPSSNTARGVKPLPKMRRAAMRVSSGDGVRTEKLGERVARRIIADIHARGWRTGEVLGTETELLQRYGVSRATFREAVRQVEKHGAASMRRGVGGGLVVDAPAQSAVARAMVSFFELTRAGFEEQRIVREQLELTAVRLACARVNGASAAHLDQALSQLRTAESFEEYTASHLGFWVNVAEASLNPALRLFIDALNGVSRVYFSIEGYDRTSTAGDRDSALRLKRAIVTAIAARDSEEAQALVRKYAARRMRLLTTKLGSDLETRRTAAYLRVASESAAETEKQKLSERTALAIVEDISRARWKEGYGIGTEAELQDRHCVSRAVLREAVRQLELHGIVKIKSGVGGGLQIGRISSEYTEEVICTYLHAAGIGMEHLWEIEAALADFAIEQLTTRITAKDCEALRTVFSRVEAATPANYLARASDLHAEIADRTGNRVLSLFYRVLLRFGLEALPPVLAEDVPWLVRTHGKLVESACNGDVAEARRLMGRLFSQSRRWVSASQ